MAKVTLDTLTSAFSSIAKLNSNFSAIVSVLQNKVLFRDNPAGEPNQMENELDMNGNDISNAGYVQVTSLSINGVTVDAADVVPVETTYMQAGTEAAPGFYVYGDDDTGLYSPGLDQLAISVGGAAKLTAATSGVTIPTLSATTIVTGAIQVAGACTFGDAVALPADSTATTQAASDDSTKVATTAFVQDAIVAYVDPEVAAALATATATVSHTRATQGSAQTISTGTPTVIQFGTEEYDALGDYSTGTYRFTAPANGYYAVAASTSSAANSYTILKTWRTDIYVDGVQKVTGQTLPLGNGATYSFYKSSVSTTLYLTAGQYVDIRVYQDLRSTLDTSGSAVDCWFTVDRLR